jgi:cell wall-associated NlpC family hydrolase
VKRTRVGLVALAAVALCVSAPVANARAVKPKPRNWAYSAIRTIVRHHILPEGTTVASYRPNAALDATTLYFLLNGAVPNGAAKAGILPSPRAITMGQLDAAFVRARGLLPLANQALVSLRRAGYTPRPDAGTELVARLMRLRLNHPMGQDALERSDTMVATRAEAAWTTVRVLAGADPGYAREIVAKLAGLPPTAGERHAVIDRAIHMLGEPYVWGGTWEKATGGPNGSQLAGGFDCSGLVWRVMALDPAALPGTAARIGGRTTYDMARTTVKTRRLRAAVTRPGDILLFSPAGRRAGWQSVDHAGIALGGGLFINSGSKGVAIDEYDVGYYHDALAWGKSVLP